MKNQKGFFVPLLIIIALAVGVAVYEYQKSKYTEQSSVTATSTPTNQPSATSTPAVSVAGMSQYTDSTFGFSFWYPNSWTVTQEPPKMQEYSDGTVLRDLVIKPNDSKDAITGLEIDEVHSSTMSITDPGEDTCGTCSPVRYYFSTSTDVWMTVSPEGTPQTGSTSPFPANTPGSSLGHTMGGLYMFSGSQRFGSDTIIPINHTDFVVVRSVGFSISQQPLATTIIVINPSVAVPVSTSQQVYLIQTEEDAYIGK